MVIRDYFLDVETSFFDEYGQVINNEVNALRLHQVLKNYHAFVIQLALGNLTSLTVSVIDIAYFGVGLITDGSVQGYQVNIDRLGCYGFPKNQEIAYFSMEKLGINNISDAKLLAPFLNTVLNGEE